MHWLLRFVITAVAMYAIAAYVPGFHISGWGAAIVAAIIFGIVNAIIGPILRLISLPLTILTIGLFSIVVNWILFALAVWLSPGLKTTGFSVAGVGVDISRRHHHDAREHLRDHPAWTASGTSVSLLPSSGFLGVTLSTWTEATDNRV